MTPSLTEDSKNKFVETCINKELINYQDKNLGCFVGLKSFSLIFVRCSSSDNNYLQISVKVQAYFFITSQKDVIHFRVKKILPKYIEGLLYNIRIDLPIDQVSTSTVTYNSANNSYVVNDGSVKIRENDLVRARVTGFFKLSTSLIELNYLKLKVTCRNNGLGKVE